MPVTRLRKKPITVEAIQFDGTNAAEIKAFTRGSFHLLPAPHPGDPDVIAEVWDKLHHTWVGVKAGNWIIRGPAGEHYPVDDGIRQATYDITGTHQGAAATARYRQKPEPPAAYEAVHWTGKNCAEVFVFLGLPHPKHDRDTQHDEITLPADSQGRPGTAWLDDWILRDVATGDFESYGDEDFRSNFEPDIPNPFTWAGFVDTHTAGETAVVIPVNKNGEWTGDVALDLAAARELYGALGKALAEAGDE